MVEAQSAVPLVGSLFGDDVHQCRAIAAELGGEIVSGYAHFLHVFGIGVDVGDAVALAGIDGRGVDEKAVGLGPGAIGAEIDAVFRVEDVTAGLRVSLSTTAGQTGHARGQHHQGVEIPAGERKVVDFFLGNPVSYTHLTLPTS